MSLEQLIRQHDPARVVAVCRDLHRVVVRMIEAPRGNGHILTLLYHVGQGLLDSVDVVVLFVSVAHGFLFWLLDLGGCKYFLVPVLVNVHL